MRRNGTITQVRQPFSRANAFLFFIGGVGAMPSRDSGPGIGLDQKNNGERTPVDMVRTDLAGANEAAAQPWPSPARAWYAIFVFALALMMNFLDRGIVGLLVRPLEQDLHLNDFQISLITGFAYITFYAAVGLPIARWADVGVRRTIVGIGIAVWSLATAFCGLAQNFSQLFIARMAVGAGESCNGPAVFSMISDLFPPHKLPRAIAVLNFGFIGGTGLAAIFGGAVIHLLSNTPSMTLPVLGPLHTWQLVFLAVGLPGLLVAALLWTVPEPARRGRVAGADGRHVGIPLREVMRFFLANRATYFPLFLGLALNTVVAFGVIVWSPEYFRRTFAWNPADFALMSGVFIIAIAPFGAMFGSWLAERFHAQGRDDANLRVVVMSIALNAPCMLLFTLAPTPTLALVGFGLTQFVTMWVPGPMNAALQVVTPNEMRATVTALFLFIFNIIGFGAGPSVAAAITQYGFQDPRLLNYALAMMAGVLCPLAALSIWYGIKAYAQSVRRAQGWGQKV
jgi:MFS family permease